MGVGDSKKNCWVTNGLPKREGATTITVKKRVVIRKSKDYSIQSFFHKKISLAVFSKHKDIRTAKSENNFFFH